MTDAWPIRLDRETGVALFELLAGRGGWVLCRVLSTAMSNGFDPVAMTSNESGGKQAITLVLPSTNQYRVRQLARELRGLAGIEDVRVTLRWFPQPTPAPEDDASVAGPLKTRSSSAHRGAEATV